MKHTEFKEYSNAAQIRVENIPQEDLQDIAAILYGIFCRVAADKKNADAVENTS